MTPEGTRDIVTADGFIVVTKIVHTVADLILSKYNETCLGKLPEILRLGNPVIFQNSEEANSLTATEIL